MEHNKQKEEVFEKNKINGKRSLEVTGRQIKQSAINPLEAYFDYQKKYQKDKTQCRTSQATTFSDASTSQGERESKLIEKCRSIKYRSIFKRGWLNLSLLHTISFQISGALVEETMNFIKTYPIESILPHKVVKRVQKLTRKSSEQVNFPTPFAYEDNNLKSLLDVSQFISNPIPNLTLRKLVEAQFFYFVIGDYSKLKHFRPEQECFIEISTQNDNLSQKEQKKIITKETTKETNELNNLKCDNNQTANTDSMCLTTKCVNLCNYENIKQDEKSQSVKERPKQDWVDEFIASKSATTTSKLAKMHKNVLGNVFEEFSSQQLARHNPNRNQFYNLPKYSMVLILKLLSQKNLINLGVSEEFQQFVRTLVKRVKQSAKIKEQKKQIMYNHNHFNCLFLKLTEQNMHEVTTQLDLCKLHMLLFGVDNIQLPFNYLFLNLLKSLLQKVVIAQLELINSFPITQYILSNSHLYQFEKSKINYIHRVIIGIQKLTKGEIIKRF